MNTLILSCNPANNELKPGQRQPLPKKAAGVKRQALTPGPGLHQIIVNPRLGGVPRMSDVARTFGGCSLLRIPGEGRGAAASPIGCTARSAASACRRSQAGRMSFLTSVRSSKRTRRTKAVIR